MVHIGRNKKGRVREGGGRGRGKREGENERVEAGRWNEREGEYKGERGEPSNYDIRLRRLWFSIV